VGAKLDRLTRESPNLPFQALGLQFPHQLRTEKSMHALGNGSYKQNSAVVFGKVQAPFFGN
jgi:hypothetical protein